MNGESLKILLVDDNIDQRELLQYALQKNGKDHLVTSVEDGPACLEEIKRSSFDAIILDYSLPRMNGLEVLSEIQARGHHIPVVMVTGQGDEGIAVEAMKRGACDYIIKSSNYLETLMIVLEKVIEKHQLEKNLKNASMKSKRLYEISLSVTKERNMEVIARNLVSGSRQLMETEGAVLLLMKTDGSAISLCETSGIDLDQDSIKGPIELAGFLGQAYLEKRTVIVEDGQGNPGTSNGPRISPPVRQFFSVPILREEGVTGVLTVLNKQDQKKFSAQEITILSTLVVHAGVAFDNANFLKNMEQRAITDSLTGLYNHREFQKRLRDEAIRASRYGKEFSLLMLDIDFFKVFNDTHGHPVGDSILMEIAGVLEECIREVDIASRYGGEEFTLILPETYGEQAEAVAERIRKGVSEKSFMTPTGYPAHLSVSIGIASFPRDTNDPDDLIRKADQALYFAKRDGRNRTCIYHNTLKSKIEKDKEKLAEILRDPEIKVIRDLAAVIDAKSPYTRGHSEAILQYAMEVGDAIRLNEEEKKSLQMASLLHDIGTISIPETLINKPGPLSIEERKIIQAHPGLAKMLIEGSEKWENVLPAILYHHERYDGKGYPNGLRGEAIPLLARILSVVESYYSMISVRPYRPRMNEEEAIEQLNQNAGSQFDPHLVDVFVKRLTSQDGDPSSTEEER